jgi:hypothetical protein
VHLHNVRCHLLLCLRLSYADDQRGWTAQFAVWVCYQQPLSPSGVKLGCPAGPCPVKGLQLFQQACSLGCWPLLRAHNFGFLTHLAL